MTRFSPTPLQLNPLLHGHAPPWAVAWGEDLKHGVWAELAVGRARQRMRWIPPGTFLMGSLEDEEGRYDDEVQHEVTLTEGLWLGDTPVTQALWSAVMGDNPSRFQTPNRPVEQVSWDDAKRFCEQLSRSSPGAPLRLPTEREWERACRAGTQGSTWLGPLKILGENKAPGLDRIAWYGGNSGVDLDLPADQAVDSSNWPQKQHPHQRAASREVKGKDPNPWGLYDMLGNVWEWCEDEHAPYAEAPRTDPADTESARRVFRGGSWGSSARFVRAAFRVWDRPGGRDNGLGFRLARGPEPAAGGDSPGGAPRARSAKARAE